jgi:S-adenosylmethionine-dependent methyltransferase
MAMNRVESFYDNNAQVEWGRFDRHRTEFAITRRALAQHLPPPPARVLDCGGGPGRYSIYLAQQGYQVTLLDLSAANLSLASQKAQEMGVVLEDVIHGNALDLSFFAPEQFDVVLLLGPLYHLTTDADRRQALGQVLRVLKPGGRIFSAFITLYAGFRDAIAKGYLGDYVEKPELVRHLLDEHVNPPDSGFTDAWFCHPDEARGLLESFHLRTLAFLGVEGLTAGHEQHINALEEPAFEFWADLIYRFASDPYLLGASDHLLHVGQRD